VVHVRRYQPADLGAIKEICVLTGHTGQDARGSMMDTSLLPDTFAEPYIVYDPLLAFVADDEGTAVGYVLGTADTVAFAEWFQNTWLPMVAPRHAGRPAEVTDFESLILELMYTPARMVHDDLAPYPAHLHIDLLPEYHGLGLGRQLMDAFRGELASRGVEKLHLSMDPKNVNARAFYDRLGFEPITVSSDPGGTYLGRSSGG
jgi:ribosomal protein S18 acetylase RimI-like enzyme